MHKLLATQFSNEKLKLSKRAKILSIATILLIAVISSIFAIPQFTGADSKSPSTAHIVWEKTYGGPLDDRAFYSLPTSNGYLIIGSTKSVIENTTVGWALQVDFEGNPVWNKSYLQGFGTELRYALNLTDGYLLIGNEFLEDNNIIGYVIKTDSHGNLLWNATIGGNNVNKLFSAIETCDGFLLVGISYPNGSDSMAWVVKIDPAGKVIWENQYPIGVESALRQGILAPDGSGFILTGYTKVENYRFLALKIDQTGKLIWNVTYGDSTDDQKAYSIAKANDGFVIVGDKISMVSDSDALVTKVDWNGTMIWEKTVGGKYADSAACVTRSVDGGYLVGGFTFSFGQGNRDFWLFKISTSGVIEWSCIAGDSGYQEAYQVLDAGENQYIVVGWTDPPNQPALIGNAQYDFYIGKLSP